MSDTLTAKECGVIKWCEKPLSVSIFFHASSGKNVMFTFISYSDTFSDLLELVRNTFIEAFRPSILSKDPNELGMITVTTHGYGDRYHCFFKEKDVPEHIEYRILTSDDWLQLSAWDKIIRWACELETHMINIIKKYKVQLLD